jgi:heme-degrading monooxygenase HmoA
MHAVVRTYSGKGAKELIDVLEKSKAEVENLIRRVQGFVSFSLVRTASGGFSVSVFQDKAGADESVRVAREWIAKNAASIGAAPPAISEGTVILEVK